MEKDIIESLLDPGFYIDLAKDGKVLICCHECKVPLELKEVENGSCSICHVDLDWDEIIIRSTDNLPNC